jgi:hypothetical protein
MLNACEQMSSAFHVAHGSISLRTESMRV